MELQARWIANILAGKVPPPLKKDVKRGLLDEKAIRYIESKTQFPRSNYVGFMYQLAEELNAVPEDFINNDDPFLPMIPADFRRNGIGANFSIANKQRDKLTKRIRMNNA